MALMVAKLNSRLKTMNERTPDRIKPIDAKVTDTQLFQKLGNKMKVVKRGD